MVAAVAQEARRAGRGVPPVAVSGGLRLMWLLLAALLLLLAGGRRAWSAPAKGTGGSAAQPTISFRAENLPPPGAMDPTSIVMRRLLRAFAAAHPNYQVKSFAMPQVGGGQSMDTGPLMAIAAGVPPNAIYVNFRQSSTYIEHGFLAPLEILLARVDSTNPAERQTDAHGRWVADPTAQEISVALAKIKARVVKPAWPVVYRPGPDGQKHAWSIPMRTLVMALLYRKDLFYAAGLDPDKPPATWAQLLEDARKLTVPAKRQYGLGLYGGRSISWGTYTFLVSSGARVMAMKNGRWHAVYDTKEAAEAYYFLWQLVNGSFQRDGQTIEHATFVDPGTTLLPHMWQQGQIAMEFSYLNANMIADINPQLVGIAPVPVSPAGTRHSELNCAMLGAFAGSPHDVQLAVMRYIWFLSSEQAQRIRVQTLVDQGYGQFVNPALLAKFGYTNLLRRVPQGWAQTFQLALAHGVPEPYGHNTDNIYNYLSEPINRMRDMNLGKMPKDQALATILDMLHKSAAQVNYAVLGTVAPSVMRFRRTIALITVLVVGLLFTISLGRVWRHFSVLSAKGSERRKLRKFIWGYVLLLPAFGLVVMWAYVPLGGGLAISFSDYELVRHSSYVGLTNFANALFDPTFWQALGRTFYFVALVIGLGFWPPILLGILLQEVPTEVLKYFYRTVFYLPAIIPGVIVMFLWAQLYEPDKYGTLNQLLLSVNGLGPVVATAIKLLFAAMWVALILALIYLPWKLEEMSKPLKFALWLLALLFVGVTVYPVVRAVAGAGSVGAAAGNVQGVLSSLVGPFHLKPLRWTQDTGLAMLCVVIPMVWAGSGPGSILYLAALKTVPDELYEAADIDGAGTWHKVFYITLPRMKFLIIIQFLAAVLGAFKGGTSMILALTGGGPQHATTILALKIFFSTFLELRFGFGTAMAWILAAILIWFTAHQLKMLARAEFTAAGAGA